MFKWIKRRQQQELVKLLFQNGAATDYFENLFVLSKDFGMAEEMRAKKEVIHRLSLQSQLSVQDRKTLLDMNSKLRKAFDVTPDPESLVRQKLGMPVKRKTFDDTFKPALGWDDYYKNY